MNDTKMQWAPAGLEKFSQLEDKIFQTVEEIKSIRGDAEALRDENSRLNELLKEQIDENEAHRNEIGRLTQEYEKLQGENGGLQKQVEAMRQAETETWDMLAKFEKEREELRARVENSLSLLKSLNG